MLSHKCPIVLFEFERVKNPKLVIAVAASSIGRAVEKILKIYKGVNFYYINVSVTLR